MTAAISVTGLTKRFGDRTVVDDLALEVPRGAIYGFLGPNGSGKTTTIRMVCGLLKPDAGRGRALGFDVISESDRIKERTGYMTQKFSLYEDLSIRENLEFIARLYRLDDVKGKVDESLEKLGLSERAAQLAGRLSGGWKQRLALAACMIHTPDLLLLDEPTAGVDPKARRDFWDEIRRYSRQGVTTLVSTHYMDEAVQCDSIAYIAYGRKLVDAPTRDIPKLVGLSAWRILSSDLDAAEAALRGAPGVELVARFGAELHAAGRGGTALASSVSALKSSGATVEPMEAGLEEAFIHLMSHSADNFR
ncbi:MAG: ABC-2 type transport system ATP-binding protein [Alphaproteobacteria bacterium]|nr:MAG: ABC-2 type transport system ATP-binding protein [Caulobacteraceae bacterium]TPW03658.1 MAG: ABC-2 type transport system ATP-binding protein [Alphaproteobacteria bacterium]